MRDEGRVLVVDDHVEMARLLADQLGDHGYQVKVASRGDEAIRLLSAEAFELVITDLRMEGTDGLEVLAAARAADPELPVLIMTAFGGVEGAVEAMKRGAHHYFTKPFRLDEVLLSVRRALEARRLRVENRQLRRAAEGASGLIGRSAAMRALEALIGRAADSPAPALVLGESGSGKELVARALHALGPRAGGPFVPVNCTALPAALLESELFGHLKGAYTGASQARRGLFVEASGGTLFLDEIGDMAPELQARLLRVLEDGTVRPVGADAPRKVDVRVVAATHQPLEQRVAEGRFRADLFFRLNVLPIRVPPLRDRREDLPLLIEHFLSRARERNPRAVASRFSPEAMAALLARAWPGNVRELENFVERAVVVGASEVVDVSELPLDPLSPSATAAAAAFRVPAEPPLPLRELEAEYIAWMVARCGGNKTRAAELLGIDVSTIHRRGKLQR